ncbi:MAG TPA: NUDIX domain-containing protein [Gemmatimonadaceae bacterium]|nr:NUDIX domain-containing protein [Gemmatimonadaceae bacterium]
MRAVTLSIDVVLLSAPAQRLQVLLRRAPEARGRTRWVLPWDGLRSGESPEAAAQRIGRLLLGVAPADVEQLGVFAGSERHPGAPQLSIALVGLLPATNEAPRDELAEWHDMGTLPTLPPRQSAMIASARRELRLRAAQGPVAFHLLPAAFTLTELQETYELLLGHRLHKASFRRTLQAAALVTPLDEWRSDGRGRPAQLFRYAPRSRPDEVRHRSRFQRLDD